MIRHGHLVRTGLVCGLIHLAWWSGCPGWDGAAYAQPSDTRSPVRAKSGPSEKRYDGATIEQWLDRIRRLDPKSPFNAWAVPGLIEIVKDEQLADEIRRQAAMTLGRMGTKARAAVPILIERLDPEQTSFEWAASALPFFAHNARQAAPRLVEILEDPRLPARQRIAAMEGLARIGSSHPDAIPALSRALHARPSDTAAMSAADAVEFRELAADALAVVGPAAELAVPLLMRTVRDPRETESVRRKAIRALGAIGPAAELALPAVVESLEFDESPAVQDAAAETLIALGEAALPVVERYLQHPDVSVRWRIAAALASAPKKSRRAVMGMLLKAAQDPQPLVRIAACESLQTLEADPRRMAPVAIPLLGSDDRQIRMRALRLLPQLAPLAADEQAVLQQLQQDPRPIVRKTAEKAAEKVQSTANGP